MLDILHVTPTRSNANVPSSAKPHPDPTRPQKSSASEPTSAKAQQTHYDRPPRSGPNTVVTVLDRAAKLALGCRDVVYSSLRTETAAFKKRRRELESLMNNATSYEEWETAARALDKFMGNDLWKDRLGSGEYCVMELLDNMRRLDEATQKRNFCELLFLIRTTLSRDLGGMGSSALYRHSHTGTKTIIQRYVQSATRAIETMVELAGSAASRGGMGLPKVLQELEHTRRHFGRSALMLSGGATYGMTHIGVIKALFEQNLLPRIVSGASAGSIVCAVLCTHTDEDLPRIIKEFPYGELDVFEEQGRQVSIAKRLWKLLTEWYWYDETNLVRVMRNLIGDVTFREAYNRTRRICNITVSIANNIELPRLLNYRTSPDVMIWSAVAVSCSVPGLFKASSLMIKDPKTGEQSRWFPSPQRWIDGSIDNDLPTTRLAEMFAVNHFIVSQVNPHVVPFLERDDVILEPEERESTLSTSFKPSVLIKNIFSEITSMATEELLYRLTVVAENTGPMSNILTKVCSILSQQYSGDITIIPKIEWGDMAHLVTNPTSEFMLKSCLIGERGTWPKLRRIRDHCAIELCLDRAITDLMTLAAFSPSQVNLRRSLGLHSGDVGQPVNRLHHRERRPSDSNIHMIMRQRQNNLELEQLLSENEWRLESTSESDDEDEDGGVMLKVDNRPRRRKTSSGAGAAQNPEDRPRKPVLRRAARSHQALHFKALARLSSPMANPLTKDLDDLDGVTMGLSTSRSGTPGDLNSPTSTTSSHSPRFMEAVRKTSLGKSPFARTEIPSSPADDTLIDSASDADSLPSGLGNALDSAAEDNVQDNCSPEVLDQTRLCQEPEATREVDDNGLTS
ncbi:uncharacterized protein PgNI_02333 [Pyricularia grisea]|uniref:Patatin-like phospholipase domain-containing protein n=1 Tax=Pyricularia grisea TaxID=148305 RepID=A0A6P8BJE9_PYRGI|nr:uncharacterized protein PgNI_02333 [Pyricularia grisea]TLD16913.1 hypothetical protein PgNI_02333 [Pyricularia grisea]